jgi:GTPase
MLEDRRPITAEKALLVGLYTTADPGEPDLALDELGALVEAAGGEVAGRTYQRRQGHGAAADRAAVTPATFIGRGKAAHVAELVENLEANVVVFDNELSPAQIRELEKIVGCKVIDRSELILDIFASRARTREAKLQVELAQLEYTAPRLRGMWTHLERQAGTGGSTVGLGMKGPGEKQIEIDRRIVRSRITRLRHELGRIHGRKEREVAGRAAGAFTVGLVGYTNAGKSTLMNALTGAGTYQADQLFATLDTKTRRWPLEPGVAAALSDTVGFIRNLPHHLVASFRSTLEEALTADLLLHVIDASHPQAIEQVAAVERVLVELGCDLGRVLPVLNKIDRITDEEHLSILRARLHGAVAVSARTGQGISELSHAVAARRRAAWICVRVEAPAANGEVQAFARSRGLVRSERYEEDVWIAEIELARASLPRLRRSGEVRVEELSRVGPEAS